MCKITVESDYDGYFERLVRGQLALTNPRREEIVISAGPWRPYGCAYQVSEDGKVLRLDFYSALRNGFGSFDPSDLQEVL